MTDQNFIKTKEEGKSYLQKKNYDKAIECYLECLTFKEVNVEELSILNLNIGICYMSKTKLEDAFLFIEKAIDYNPQYQKAHYRKIQCLLQMGKLQESLNLCKNMIKQYPDVQDFSNLIKQIQEQILKEQNEQLSWDQYSSILGQENIADNLLKDTLCQIQIKIESRSGHKKIFMRGGFLDQMLKNASQQCKNNNLTISFILNNIFKVTEEEKSFQIPQDSVPFILEIFKENQKEYSNEQSKKLTEDSLRILQYSDILISGEGVLEIISNSKFQDEILTSTIGVLSSLCYNNITYYLQSHSYHNIDTLSDKLQSVMEWTAAKLKTTKKGDILYRQFLQLLFKLQFKLNPQYLDKKYFYRKEKLSKVDMIFIQEMLISSYQQAVQKVIDNDLQRCLFATYLKKPTDIVIIDCILSIYSILLKEQQFIDKVMKDIAFQDFNIQIQRFLVTNKHELTYIIKYGILLFKTNKQKQLPELVSFLRIFSFSEIFDKILLISEETQFTEAMEFIGFMSCFDQFKVELIEASKNLLYKLSLKVNFDNYEQGLNWLITISNLCFDQLKDYELKQKDKFGLSDEKLSELKMFEEKYRADDVKQAKEIFRYNEEYIKEKQVAKILVEEVGVIKYLSQFIIKQSKNGSELMMTYLAQLLSKLIVLSSKSNTIDKALFDKNLVIFSARGVNSINQQKPEAAQLIIQFTTYISKLIKDCNPNIFQYSEVHIIIDALFKGLKASQHELLTFEILLSLVQMTSLGEQTTSKLVNTETLSLLQNLLMEDQNYYIVHSALEVINNICLNEKMMERIGKMATLIQLIFAHFDNCFDKLLKQAPDQITKSYDEPLKIINTIYNILAINASNEAFKEKASNHICSQPDTLVSLLQKYSKNDGYMRMEFLYKFVFMTQSMRGKKFTGQEKQMIQKIYEEIKDQYKKECKGNIPKNDTRFEYMDSILQ